MSIAQLLLIALIGGVIYLAFIGVRSLLNLDKYLKNKVDETK